MTLSEHHYLRHHHFHFRTFVAGLLTGVVVVYAVLFAVIVMAD